MSKNHSISVVIPVLDEERTIRLCFESLLKQTHLPKEIIVVDGGSKDKTIKIIKQEAKTLKKKGVKTKIIVEPRRGIVLARDIGFRVAKGELIASCDADTFYPSNYLEVAASRIKKDYVAVTGRGDVKDPPWFIKIDKTASYLRDKIIFSLFNTCFYPRAYNIVFSRAAYLKTSGMDTSAVVAEDERGLASLLNSQGKIYFEPRLRAITSSRRHRLGGVVYYLIRTIIIDYWFGYIRSKYLKQKVNYPRVN